MQLSQSQREKPKQKERGNNYEIQKSNGICAVYECCIWATAIPAYAQTEKQTVLEQEGIVPYALVIKSGSVDDEDFTYSVKLNKENGKYINFWIKNTGNKDIAITINGDARRVIEPGDQGHIYVEASTFSKTYKFHAESANSAGKISMDYRIAQRDEPTP